MLIGGRHNDDVGPVGSSAHGQAVVVDGVGDADGVGSENAVGDVSEVTCGAAGEPAGLRPVELGLGGGWLIRHPAVLARLALAGVACSKTLRKR